MWTIYRKEVVGFFSSLTGYVAGGVFLVLLGLLLWVLPTGYNVIGRGEANLGGMFDVAPWVLLFLVPAVTMRMLSEERRDGTLEMLLSRPVSEWGVAWAKFLAAWTLVLSMLLPTLLYYLSLLWLGDQAQPLDHAALWGSYLGLTLLGGVYAAIGLFVSAHTRNPLVAFLLSALLCLAFYMGFEMLAQLLSATGMGSPIARLGIADHYESVSRGVVDSRDIVYFASLILLGVLGVQQRLVRDRG